MQLGAHKGASAVAPAGRECCMRGCGRPTGGVAGPAAAARRFHDLPDAIANTAELALRLSFTLKDLGYRFPESPLPPGHTALSHLRELAERGVRARYDATGTLAARARRQVAHELEVIGRLDLA